MPDETTSRDDPSLRAGAYPPIEDHGAIGNLRSVALVARNGTIDWCCFPRLDSGSVFASILDHARGGHFSIRPRHLVEPGDQHYVEDTNVLVTEWQPDGCRLTLTDFMPLRGSIHGTGDPPAPTQIFRVLRCEGGDCEVQLEWAPRFNYARTPTRIDIEGSSVTARGGAERLALAGIASKPRVRETEHGPVAHATFLVRAGETVPLTTWFGEGNPEIALDGWEEAQRDTEKAWRDWVHERDQGERCSFAGKWQEMVNRSGLVLKMLTYPRTGAIVAAPTTSLPEEIGGVRNWDYRYTWIRDASFTAQALVALGHRTEAVDFVEWAERTCMDDDERPGHLHLMYTLYGEADIPEVELEHFEGYRQSRPVRIGNKASGQFQLDIYGELLGAAWELIRIGGSVDEDRWEFLTRVADQACEKWREPDYGIWEVRSEPQHFVYSKLMVWVALDRALRIAERCGLSGPLDRWRRTRDAVREEILVRGFDKEQNSFVQAYDSRALDAANLLIGTVGFLPMEDPRIQGTIDRTLKKLTKNGLVHRYLTEDAVDGIEGGEGAFGLTTFWLIDALALSGRLDEARALFENVAARANHLGLYAEEFDPASGIFLGNFPQAFTHIGFINSAVYIANAEGREIPTPAPIGSVEQKEEEESAEGQTSR